METLTAMILFFVLVHRQRAHFWTTTMAAYLPTEYWAAKEIFLMMPLVSTLHQ